MGWFVIVIPPLPVFSFWFLRSKAAEFPFPWDKCPTGSQPSTAGKPTTASSDKKRECITTMEPLAFDAKRRTSASLPPSPRFQRFLIECRTVGRIEMKMGDLNSASTAGAILQHSIRTLERLFVEQEPLIFKIGFSHNPVWRWTNDVYGYQHAREKWSNMDILFYCKEPYSPAMLEAALVEKFKSTHSAENNCSDFLCFF